MSGITIPYQPPSQTTNIRKSQQVFKLAFSFSVKHWRKMKLIASEIGTEMLYASLQADVSAEP
jgi:hypothetical protein